MDVRDVRGETVVDSRHAKLLHEHGHLPVLYFPRDEVRIDLLEPSDHSARCPWKGDAAHWSVRAGDTIAENAVWGYPEPIDGAPPLAGYLAVHWSEMDEWLEEDEPAWVHVRDPYHRVDILDSSRKVRVSLDGELLAERDRPASALVHLGRRRPDRPPDRQRDALGLRVQGNGVVQVAW